MKAAVEMEDVHVAFNGRDVVRGVSASLPDRGISVIIGRSGCGKTTLLRVLNRLNEEFPGCRTSGRVELNLGAGPEAVYPAPGVRPRPFRSCAGWWVWSSRVPMSFPCPCFII